MLNNTVLSVSQLNRYVKALFDDNRLLTGLLLKGEISNLSDHFSSGHLYFSLKDSGAAIKAVMFKSYAQQLKFRPQNGQTVLVNGAVSLYERDGVYQLYIYDMQPDGAGALALAFEQLKQKLAEEGLFAPEKKRPLPCMPQKIGVITSQTGAALQDILSILGRRYPIATVLLAPVAVQGENAATEMIAALHTLNERQDCDVLVLGRGGGSAEDLSAFNDEGLARAIFASTIPIVSAVGHETDFTIADFVADLRAPTPSAAAELMTPRVEELAQTLAEQQDRLTQSMDTKLAAMQTRLSFYRSHRALQSPRSLLDASERRLEQLQNRLLVQMEQLLTQRRSRLGAQAGLLSSLSPLNVLARGYAIAFHGEKTVTSATEVAVGTSLQLRLAKGGLEVKVMSKTEENA